MSRLLWNMNVYHGVHKIGNWFLPFFYIENSSLLTTGTGHTVQSWNMQCKYRTIVHSPHSRRARILQDTADWTSLSPTVHITHPSCLCVITVKEDILYRSALRVHSIRGGKTAGSSQDSEDRLEKGQYHRCNGTMSQMNPVHAFLSSCFKSFMILSCYLCLGPISGPFPSSFPTELQRVCHTPRPSPPVSLEHSDNNILPRVQFSKFLITRFYLLLHLQVQVLSAPSFSDTLSVMFFPKCERQISRPYKTHGVTVFS